VLAPTDVPAWDPQDENYKLVAVQDGTDEWDRIQAQLQASLPGAEVVQVLRVQNPTLAFTYKQRQERMQMINDPKNNEAAPLEMWLWHGAHLASVCLMQCIGHYRKTMLVEISDNAGDNNLWGKGIYFTEKAAYSNVDKYVFQVCFPTREAIWTSNT
jgi:hypothetical protein